MIDSYIPGHTHLLFDSGTIVNFRSQGSVQSRKFLWRSFSFYFRFKNKENIFNFGQVEVTYL